MSEVIPLSLATSQIAKVENEIRKGEVVVIPVDGSYVYLADAFNHLAVKKIHDLRGDEVGTALSVAIGNSKTLFGIAVNITDELNKLIDKFWPGPLTIYVQPNSTLNWNLGDSGVLGEFAVRIPNSELLISLANAIGPLAMASAANAGMGAARNLDEVSALTGEINFYVDAGLISTVPPSTVVRSKVIGASELEVLREGAISLIDLREIVPTISLASPE